MHLNRPKLFKTKLCKYHQERRCKNGALCEYAHDALEVRPMPNLRKTKLCPRYVQGRCTAGGDCKYAHNEQELRATVDFYKTSLCSEWALSGQCGRGEVCRYAHGAHELRAPGGGNPAPGAVAAASAKLAAPGANPASTSSSSGSDSAVLPVAPASAPPPLLTSGALGGLPVHSSPPLRPPPAMPPSMPPRLPPGMRELPLAEGLPNARYTPMPLPLAHLTAGNEGGGQQTTTPPPGYFVRNTGRCGSPIGDTLALEDTNMSLMGNSLPSTAPVALPSPWPIGLAKPTWPPPPPSRAAPSVLPERNWEEMALPPELMNDAGNQVALGPGNSSVNGLPGPPSAPPLSEAPQIGLATLEGAAPEPLVWSAYHGQRRLSAAAGVEVEGVSDKMLPSQGLCDAQGESKLGMDSANPRQALAIGPIGTSRPGVNTIGAIGGGGANCIGTGGGRDPLSPWHVLPLTRLPVTPEKLLPDDPTTDEGDSASDGSGSMTNRSRPMSSFRTPPGLSLDGQRPAS